MERNNNVRPGFSGWKHGFTVDRRFKAGKGPEPDNVCADCGSHKDSCHCGVYSVNQTPPTPAHGLPQ